MEGLDDGDFRLCLRNDIAFFYRRLYFFAIEISVWVNFFRIVENFIILLYVVELLLLFDLILDRDERSRLTSLNENLEYWFNN